MIGTVYRVSMMDVGYKQADEEKVLRRIFLQPWSHDKITGCLLFCPARLKHKGGRSLCRTQPQEP